MRLTVSSRCAGGGAQMLQQPHPHGRHAGGHGHALLIEDLVHVRTVQVPAGHDQGGAGQRGAIGNAPGIDMKHRHDRQHPVDRAQAQRVRDADAIGVQQGGAVAVEHALGPPGGAGGVAERAGGILVEFRPVIVLVCRGDQVVVAEQPHAGRQVEFGHAVRFRHHHDRPHAGGDLRRDGGEDGVEAGVREHHRVLGVVDDVGDVVGMQAGIDGVADRSHPRRAVIDFQMPVAVPGQRAHPVARLDAERLQRPDQPAGTPFGVRPGIAVDVALDVLRDDFRRPVMACRVLQHGGNHQRLRLHQSEQIAPPSGLPRAGGA